MKNFEEVIKAFVNKIGFGGKDTVEWLLLKMEVEHDFHRRLDLPQLLANYYESTVLPHKVAVYKAGVEDCKDFWKSTRIDVHNRLAEHDLSKFSRLEQAYASHNFKDKTANSPEQVIAFESAWNHHKHYNPHHPEHWFCIRRNGSLERILPMPHDDVVEMVADWIGAGRTYGNTLENWLPDNLRTFVFHGDTVNILSPILESVTTGLEFAPDYIFDTPDMAKIYCKKKV